VVVVWEVEVTSVSMPTTRRSMARRSVVLVAAGLALAGCSSSSGKSAVDAAALCSSVRVWNDQSVDAVNAFSRQSDDVDLPGRRRLYDEAFGNLDVQLHALATQIAGLPSGTLKTAMEEAQRQMADNLASARADAKALPDTAYEYYSVKDGRLFTGLEKNQAIIFQALSDVAEHGQVPVACGRRLPDDLSPSATAPATTT
jgi:hypothetical protein